MAGGGPREAVHSDWGDHPGEVGQGDGAGVCPACDDPVLGGGGGGVEECRGEEGGKHRHLHTCGDTIEDTGDNKQSEDCTCQSAS